MSGTQVNKKEGQVRATGGQGQVTGYNQLKKSGILTNEIKVHEWIAPEAHTQQKKILNYSWVIKPRCALIKTFFIILYFYLIYNLFLKNNNNKRWKRWKRWKGWRGGMEFQD
jgi:hypothetical protein